MQESETFYGVSILPRGKDVTREFSIEISPDKESWMNLGEYTLANNENVQKFFFPEAVLARYIRITCLNGYNTTKFTSIKEIKIFRNK